MKKIFPLLFFLFTFSFVHTQTLVPYLKKGLYGYADINGVVKVEPIFSAVTFYDSLGLAFVSKEDKWAIINKKGVLLTPFEVEKAQIFPLYNQQENKQNRSSREKPKREIIPHLKRISYPKGIFRIININAAQTPTYLETNYNRTSYFLGSNLNFTNGIFVGRKSANEYHVLNSNGEKLLTCPLPASVWNDSLLAYPIANQFVLYDFKNHTQEIFDYQHVHELIGDSLLVVSNAKFKYHLFDTSDTLAKKTLINRRGAVIIDSLYNTLYTFNRSHLVAGKEGKFRLLDFKGNAINELSFQKIIPLNHIYCSALLGDSSWVILNNVGQPINQRQYDKIDFIKEGNYFTYQKEALVGILDSGLADEMSYHADEIYKIPNSKLYTILKNEKAGIIDKQKQIIIQPNCSSLQFIGENNYIKFNIKGKIGLVDLAGNILFEPLYENIVVKFFNNKTYFRPRKNGFYASFDSNLNMLSDYESRVSSISALPEPILTKDRNFRLTNIYGATIGFTNHYSDQGYIPSDSTFLTIIHRNDSTFILKEDGSSLLENVNFSRINYWKSSIDFDLFSLEMNNKEGIINHKTEWIIPLGKQEIIDIDNNIIIIKKNDAYYTYKHSGNLINNQAYDFVGKKERTGWRVVGIKEPDNGKRNKNTTVNIGLSKEEMLYGYIDSYGKIKIPFQFKQLPAFKGDYIYIEEKAGNNEYESVVYDTTGHVILGSNFYNYHPLNTESNSSYHLFIAIDTTLGDERNKRHYRQGIVNSMGTIILPFKYQYIGYFLDSTYFVVRQEDSLAIVDRNENILFQYEEMSHHNKYLQNPIALAKDIFLIQPDNKTLIFNRKGQILKTINSLNVEWIKTDISTLPLLEVIENNQKYYINLENLVVYNFLDG